MSFSDDGWGAVDNEVKAEKLSVVEEVPKEEEKIVEEHVKEVYKPVVESRVQASAKQEPEVIELSDDDLPPSPIKEVEHFFEQAAPVKNVHNIPADNASDDGWGMTPKKEEVRQPIVTQAAASRLPPSRAPAPPAAPTPPPADDTIDIDLSRDLSPPPIERNRILPPQVKGAASSKGADFGRQPGSTKGAEFGRQAFSNKGPEFGRQNVSSKGSDFGVSSAKSFGVQNVDAEAKPSVQKSFGTQKAPEPEKETSQSEMNGFGKSKSTGFGGSFGGSSKPEQSTSSTSTKPSGFGGSFGAPKPAGFGGQKTDNGFGEASKQSSGFGGSDTKPSGFGGSSRPQPTGFGKAPEEPKTTSNTGFGKTAGSGFGGASNKPVPNFGDEFGKTSSSSTFGATMTKEPFGGTSFGGESTSGFGGASNKRTGFGGDFEVGQKQSSGFGSSTGSANKSAGFGGGGASGFGGAGTKQAGFGGCSSAPQNTRQPSGFGSSTDSGSKPSRFGGECSSGFGSASNKPSEFGGECSSGFGSSSNKPSGVGKSFGAEGSSRQAAGFGSSSNGFGGGQTSESKKPFGSNNPPFGGGFGGESSGGGFGGGKSSFGGESSARTTSFGNSGFSGGAQTSGGFGGGFGGETNKSGFGGDKTGFSGGFKPDKFDDDKEGFGGGFKTQITGKGFGDSDDVPFGGPGFGKSDRGFGDRDNGFGGGNRGGSGCHKCGEEGHFARECPNAGTNQGRGCRNCGEEGHIAKDCPKPRENFGGGGGACHNCGEEGHFSRECPNPKQERPCRNCNQMGHMWKECPEPQVPFGPCRNCQQQGHFAKDCPNERVRTEPTEPCRRCGEEGHWASECPSRPKDLQGNPLVPYNVVFQPEEEMFDEAVNNDDRIDFDQNVVASMGNVDVPDMASFEAFKVLPSELHDNLKRMKMNKPTPIQRAAFYPILHGHDVVACAHTGSGKTLAFLLPLMINLLEDRSRHHGESDAKPSPRLLIIAPTRELAHQTFNTARQLAYQSGLKCGLAYGGYSRSANLQHLRGFDQLGVLVATMGRLQDFKDAGEILLDKMKYIVLDEADRMVDSTDFGEEVTKLLGPPENRTQQTILFSASFSEHLQAEDLPKFVKEGYTMLQVDKFGTANEKIDQRILQCSRDEKKPELYKLLGIDENTVSVLPEAPVEKEKTLIFVNSVKFCDSLASIISSAGVVCIPMHSHQNQEARDRTLDDFRHGKYNCMVASNVCARGLNIAGLDHVINYDMPDKNGFDEYVNRIGRTARAGFTGTSTAFIDIEADREIIPSLVNVLTEAKKEVPEWLTQVNDEAEGEGAQEDYEAW